MLQFTGAPVPDPTRPLRIDFGWGTLVPVVTAARRDGTDSSQLRVQLDGTDAAHSRGYAEMLATEHRGRTRSRGWRRGFAVAGRSDSFAS